MTRISNTEVFPKDTTITGTEYLIGTDDPVTGKPTKNYEIDAIRTYIASTVDGFEQNNIVKTVPCETQTSTSYSIATIVNNGDFYWEYSGAAGVTGQMNILDTWNVVFEVPISSPSGTTAIVQNDYYLLTNQGKGVIGASSGTTLTAQNFQKIYSTNSVTLSNTQNQNPPTVYTVNASDITNPHTVLNAATGSFTVNSATADTYFIFKENGIAASTSNPTKIYRFVGANGTYGASGSATSILADFVLVDSSALTTSSSPKKSPTIRKIVVGSVIAASGDDIKEAVDRSFRGNITHNENEVLIFEAQRVNVGSGNSFYNFITEGYYWAGGLGVVNDGSASVSDYIKTYQFNTTPTVTPVVVASPEVVALGGSDISAPKDAVNASDDTYTINGSKDFIFFVYDNDITESAYKVYRFTGATGSYGAGVDTAVNGDFTEITQIDKDTPEETLVDVAIPISASQLSTLGSTPVDIILAPGSGKLAKIVDGYAKLVFGTTEYDFGAELQIKDKTSGDIIFYVGADCINSTSTIRKSIDKGPSSQELTINGAYEIDATGNPTQGDGSLVLYLLYRVVTE